ncbi:hypothetical protein CL629_00705 [bacterium]|nr:hypothetical protein [bacterium]|tara:strand:- start:1818 stop:3029 length:1212 start_codon:yes stop_codon:yes gene_type:complete
MNRKNFYIWLGLLFAFLICVGWANKTEAQEKMVLTLTPPLFKVNLGPGETWRSSIKVVNTNQYDMDLYASVMNFEARGEKGQAKFIPIVDTENANGTLAEWIEVSDEIIHIKQEASEEVPFTLQIPEDASPGGHYAAILIGTQPVKENLEGSGIAVSSLISSLIFVEVRGEIIEEGRIKEFSTNKSVYQKLEVELALRFENTGNVHLQPKGEIIIYNMWGKERGKILINQKSEFGNVLPKSMRTFNFVWKGEKNIFEAGKYKALATLTYGKENHRNVSREAYFWIIPLKSIGLIGGGIIAFFAVLIWIIRSYIKKALSIESKKLGRVQENGEIVNLRDMQKKEKKAAPSRISLKKFNKKHYKFLIFAVLIIGGLLTVSLYLRAVLTAERNFEIIIPQEQERTL